VVRSRLALPSHRLHIAWEGARLLSKVRSVHDQDMIEVLASNKGKLRHIMASRIRTIIMKQEGAMKTTLIPINGKEIASSI
jgi:hypothetical protein